MLKRLKSRWITAQLGLLCLLSIPALAVEKHLSFSSYLDSNPIESLANPEATWGIKIQERIIFKIPQRAWNIDGSLVAQGFFEPNLILDSKIIGDLDLNLRRKLTRSWHIKNNLSSFQKLYFSELQHSSRSALSVSLQRSALPGSYQELGLEMVTSSMHAGSSYTYEDYRCFAMVHRELFHDLQAKFDFILGTVGFQDIPAQVLVGDYYLSFSGEDQQDKYLLMTLHLQHSGRFIWGASLTHKKIQSNSDFAEADIWLARLYASTRLSQNIYLHTVLQGMNKNYLHNAFIGTNPFRDPEETIQNQIHLQLEQVLSDQTTFYLQYSYLKNETLYNYWFYEKQLMEGGVKFTF